MGMKPRLNDKAKAIAGVVSEPHDVVELSDAVPGTVTDSHVETCHPIPGTVSQGYDGAAATAGEGKKAPY